ncbi:MAG: PIN domain-containing protein [Lachnospiraceae bacterium]
MKKTFILDTNILLNSPYIITSLDDNDVVIPNTTIEELDTFKNAPGDLGFHARETIRILSSLRGNEKLDLNTKEVTKNKYNMRNGVPLPGGGMLRIEYNHVNVPLPEGWKKEKPDNRIIQVCLGLQKETTNRCILITNDIKKMNCIAYINMVYSSLLNNLFLLQHVL